MKTSSDVIDITEDDIQLLSRLGVPKAYLKRAWPEELTNSLADTEHSLKKNPLSAAETEILRRGGARGLDNAPGDRQRARENIATLVKASRAFVADAYDIECVAALLGLPVYEVDKKRRQRPPRLTAFELDDSVLKFPRWQFSSSRPIPHLPELLAVFKTPINALVLDRFMNMPHVDLTIGTKRVSPREWLILDLNPKLVLDSARELAGV